MRVLRQRYFNAVRDTGISALPKVERGNQFPAWETLVGLARKCNITATEVMAQIEPPPTAKETTSKYPRRFQPSVDDFLDILKAEDEDSRMMMFLVEKMKTMRLKEGRRHRRGHKS